MENKTLNQVGAGCYCFINTISGLDLHKHKRLIELGFISGTKVMVLKNSKSSKTMVIGIRGYTLSIDYMLAEKILVWESMHA